MRQSAHVMVLLTTTSSALVRLNAVAAFKVESNVQRIIDMAVLFVGDKVKFKYMKEMCPIGKRFTLLCRVPLKMMIPKHRLKMWRMTKLRFS